MSLPLQFSDFNNNNSLNKKIKPKRNRTYKNVKKRVKHFLDAMEGGDNDNDLENFEPNKTTKMQNLPLPPPQQGGVLRDEEEDVSVDNPAQLSGNMNAATYYKQYVPYYTKVANAQEISGQKDELIEKLNYMIHLLEDQQEEKTSTVTEELILYLFLGVFVIFTVDSFARAGKYTR
jgi:hypothetical protein